MTHSHPLREVLLHHDIEIEVAVGIHRAVGHTETAVFTQSPHDSVALVQQMTNR